MVGPIVTLVRKKSWVPLQLKKRLTDMVSDLKKGISQLGSKQAITGFVGGYLSDRDVANPGKGCPIAALGAEIDRKSKVHSEVISQSSE